MSVVATNTASNIGVNFNTLAAAGGVGLIFAGIDFNKTSTVGLQIGSSSQNGIIQLNGATINSVANTLIRVGGSADLTLANVNSGAGAQTMGLRLGLTNGIMDVSTGRTLTLNVIVSEANANSGIEKTGVGTLALGAANTFSGTFTATGGTTNLVVNNSLGGISALSVASGATVGTSVIGLTNAINDTAAVTVNGTLDVSGGPEIIGSLAGTSTGAFVTIGKSGGTSGTFTVGDSSSTSFAGVIRDGTAGAGTTAFIKQGNGTLTVTGASTYTGTTQVSVGTLIVNNASGSGTGSSTVTVNNAGTTLGGIGTISGAVTINGGAQITGATDGTIGALTLSSNATFNGTSGSSLATLLIDIGAGVNNSDRLTIGGVLNLSNSFDQILFSGTPDGTSSYILATATGGITGTFNFGSAPAGYQFVYMANELDLVPVPEPSTWVAGALVVVALGWSQRRRFARLVRVAV